MTGIEATVLVLLFVLGCIVGSFLNVCIYRMPRGLGVYKPRRSFCPRCEAPIEWYDNVPILSFAVLGGRCRRCRQGISWRYPVVELVTGLLFALVYHRQGLQAHADTGHLTLMMLVVAMLIVGSAIDMDWLIIPDELNLFGLAGGLLAGLLLPHLHVGTASYHTFERLTGLYHLDGLIGAAIGAVGGGGLVLIFAIIGALIFRQEALGIGDVKLMAMIGAFFGWKVVVVSFFLAPFVGLLYGIPLLLSSGERVMPFGPFLSIGAILTLVFRPSLCAYLEPLEELVGMLVG